MIHRAGSVRLLVSLLLGTIAFSAVGQVFYQSAKASLSQLLLLVAWEAGSDVGESVRPWPWADTAAVGLLEVPRLNRRQVVLDGYSGEAMAFGPGLVSVADSHVLGGHRDTHLDYLEQLTEGDLLVFTPIAGSGQRYRVQQLLVMDTRDTPDYPPPPASLTLITCFPFDAVIPGGPLRYVVVALPEADERF